MYLKSEFKRRIVRLRDCINYLLDNDGELNSSLRGFFPCLWSVFSLVWSHNCDAGCFLKSHGEDSVVYPEFTWSVADSKFLPFGDIEDGQ